MGSLQAQLDDAELPMIGGGGDTRGDRLRLGREIRAARQRARLTQEELAARVGVNPKTVANWERGDSSAGRHIALLRDILAATWQDQPAVEVVTLVDVQIQLDVREMRDDLLWRLHDQVGAEVKRRWLERQGNAEGPHGEARRLPPEARRSQQGRENGTSRG